MVYSERRKHLEDKKSYCKRTSSMVPATGESDCLPCSETRSLVLLIAIKSCASGSCPFGRYLRPSGVMSCQMKEETDRTVPPWKGNLVAAQWRVSFPSSCQAHSGRHPAPESLI